jgi:cholinesterase
MGDLLGGGKNVTAGWYKAADRAGCGGTNTTAAASVSCMRSKSWQEVMQAIKPAGGVASMGGMGDYGPSRKSSLWARRSRRWAHSC